MDISKLTAIIQTARSEGRDRLLETEGLEFLESIGISTPRYAFVEDASEVVGLDLSRFPAEQVVIKVVSTEIAHKTEVGGVAFVSRDPHQVAEAIQSMKRHLGDKDIRGFTISECISFDHSLGGELLIGAHWTEDFGPVVTYGAGGIHTEFLADNLKPGRDVAVLSPELAGPLTLANALQKVAISRLATGRFRGQSPRLHFDDLEEMIRIFLELTRSAIPEHILEIEVNPFAITPKGLVALDILVRCGTSGVERTAERPIYKIKNLLEPKTIAIIGVSERKNPGHIILNNLLREGFPKSHVHVVKKDVNSIEGCRCYPNIESIPERVDLFIVSTTARQVPEVLNTIVDNKKSEAIILIPAGLEEKKGRAGLVSQALSRLARARRSVWRGPVINGGNCLGIRSHPGCYDTYFVPEYKLHSAVSPVAPIALISQSGAFACAKISKLSNINPKYSISVGNQMDLTIGDYMTYLKDDRDIEVFAVYAEGFKPSDGLRFLKAAQEITAEGRTVLLYRAGRTGAGRKATASHTASISGDYVVTRMLAKNVGVIVAETLADFGGLLKLLALLRTQSVNGVRLGALSNAGFECVAAADNLGRFQLADFTTKTRSHLLAIFQKCRIDGIVDVHNPIDLTPMTDDAAYEEAVRAIMEDENVDVGLVGCVPMTPALDTLPPGKGHEEDLFRTESIPMRLIRLKEQLQKAWVVTVDAGKPYDAMAELLERNGVPTFRTVDRALRLFGVFCGEKMRQSRHRSVDREDLKKRVV